MEVLAALCPSAHDQALEAIVTHDLLHVCNVNLINSYDDDDDADSDKDDDGDDGVDDDEDDDVDDDDDDDDDDDNHDKGKVQNK